jgi:CBS domain-containing protein
MAPRSHDTTCLRDERRRRKTMARKTARKNADKSQVKDVMVDEVLTIESTATMLEAAEKMRDANIGMLPVMEDGTLRGVVTDRDLVVRGLSRDQRPSEIEVADCLTEPARYAEPEWTLDDALVEMARQHVGRLPVIDSGGKIVGVVTLSSLALRAGSQEDTLDAAREVARRSARIA